ncbi:WD40 repeat protein [Saccharothrix texasensis]|uniref:WD40 repeat protein n=1 Tax=Saccharothrix texasensis TaxID=103734 RepID=A0A3N1HHI4_9PSEU|nr:WD40 repeat protein [Saccharothrix texasensis]
MICDWLSAPSSGALVVTGGPGSGKSALLAHLLVSADRVLGAAVPTDGPRPPRGAFDVGVLATGLTCVDVVHRLADAAGLDAGEPLELLVGLRERVQTGHRPLSVVVDAVEEAVTVDEARHIAALLRDLADTRAVRVLAAVRTAPAGSERARILAAFGGTAQRIDLESGSYLRNQDVVDYVTSRLTGDGDLTRYRDLPRGELAAISEAVADKARSNFLVAQLVTRWLTSLSAPPVALDDFPETIGQAMDRYLDSCGPDTELTRRLLTALAFAHGDGLSRDSTWLTVANALHHGHAHTEAQLEAVFQSTANYLMERVDGNSGQPRYRLYHQALDEYLRDQCPNHAPHQAITTALIDALPLRARHRDWGATDPYPRTHLATHAAEAGLLDDLLTDPGFLLHAEPDQLRAALAYTATDHGQRAAVVYRMSFHQHRDLPPSARCRILALDAARLGMRDLQRRFDAVRDVLELPELEWRIRFATGSIRPKATMATLTGHTGYVNAVAVTEVDGRPVAVTGDFASHGRSGGTLRLWDLVEQRQIGRPLIGNVDGVHAIATTELAGRPVALTCGSGAYDGDGTVLLWDLVEQRLIGRPLSGHRGGIRAIAVAELDGRRIAVTAGDDHLVRMWDLVEQRLIGRPLQGHTMQISAIAVAEHNGRLVGVTGSLDGTVRVWDLTERKPIGDLGTHGGAIYAVAMVKVAGRLVVVTGGDEEPLRMWDLAERQELSSPITGHPAGVTAVRVTEWQGRPVAITVGSGSDERTIRVVDLVDRVQIGPPLTGHAKQVKDLAVAELHGRPAVITCVFDRSVYLWDLTERGETGRPVVGHDADIEAVAVAEGDNGCFVVTSSPFDDSDDEEPAVTVRVWDPVSQGQVGSLPARSEGARARSSQYHVIGVAELGGRPVALLSGHYTDLCMWDLADLAPVGSIWTDRGYSIRTIEATEIDGRPVVVTSCHDGAVRLWDLKAGEQIGEPLIAHADDISALAVTTMDARTVAVTGGLDRTVRVWDLAARQEIGRLVGHRTYIVAAATAELDGRPVVVTSDQETARVWDLAQQRQIGQLSTGRDTYTTHIAIAKIGHRHVVVTGDSDDTVRTWDLGTGVCLDELAMPASIECLSLGQRGTLAVAFGPDVAIFSPSLRDRY